MRRDKGDSGPRTRVGTCLGRRTMSVWGFGIPPTVKARLRTPFF
jgi:hypothetical protein